MRLEELDLTKGIQLYYNLAAGRTVDNKPIVIGGMEYEHGVGTISRSEMNIDLKGVATRFTAMAGVGDGYPPLSSVSFEVWVDGELKLKTPPLRTGDKPVPVEVDLIEAKRLVLVVTDTGDGLLHGYGIWADAVIQLASGTAEEPEMVGFIDEAAIPIAATDFNKPGIHGPRVIGTTPGRDFIYRIPATGESPMRFTARNLPDGLTIDPDTGIISGSVKNPEETVVELAVECPNGSVKRELKIVAGENKLALTPPMGWNSWNVWAQAVDDDKIRAAADVMIESGLTSFGYSYVNIDDCWEAGRDESGEILPNEKFPDMKALADYVHSKGLKIGIYSSPGPKTCGGYEGSYQHEEQDARTYAKWKMDYLKYDWCSYNQIIKDYSREEFEKPYRIMGQALVKTGRDIVYSLCNAGEGQVWEWGEKVGGNCWRATPDVIDGWGSVMGTAFTQSGREKYAGPGHWNDVDMLVVGLVGWGPNVRPSRLTPNEQITHITAWSLLTSPLLIGCDMTRLDDFTLNLLTNEEVLDVNQDPLGIQSSVKSIKAQTEVWSKPLHDGTIAVGLFNRGPERTEVTANWPDLGLQSPQPVRDLWQKKDLGEFEGSYSVSIPPHGAVLVKIGRGEVF